MVYHEQSRLPGAPDVSAVEILQVGDKNNARPDQSTIENRKSPIANPLIGPPPSADRAPVTLFG